jgi:hypothetical protein
MRTLAALKRRYEQDAPAVQLGGLASNLSRIAWHAQQGGERPAVRLFRESKYFTEWAAPRCPPDQQGLLAEVQLRLAMWERGWGSRLTPAAIAQEARQWSVELLETAGLLHE